MARVPTSVKVGPVTYAIVFDSETLIKVNRSGETNFQNLIIMLNDKVHLQYQKQTLVHEVLHCLFFQASRIFPDGFDKRVQEEELVSALESPLFGVLKDNPILLKWVTS